MFRSQFYLIITLSFITTSCAELLKYAKIDIIQNVKQNTFEIVYYDVGGIYLLNTKNSKTKKLLPLSYYNVQGKVSPNNNLLGLTYPVSDSIRLSILNLDNYQLQDIITLPQKLGTADCYFISFEWSPDSKNILYGYHKENQKTLKIYDGDIKVYNIISKEIKLIGCKSSKIPIAYLSNNIAIVGNSDDSFLVDIENCTTIFSFGQYLHKDLDIIISPNRELVLYKKNQEMYMYDLVSGKNEQLKVSDSKIDLNKISNIRWLSNNSIIFDWGIEIGIIDFGDNNEFRYYGKASERPFKIYSYMQPVVSPNKQNIAYYSKELTQMPGRYSNATFSLVVDNLPSSNKGMVLNQTSYIGGYIPNIIIDTHFWIGNEHVGLFLTKENKLNIYSLTSKKKRRGDYLQAFEPESEAILVASFSTPNIPLAIKKVH